MTEKAIVYVGSDERQEKAELALEYSIRKHASIPVEIIFMRGLDDGPWKDWAYNWQMKPKRSILPHAKAKEEEKPAHLRAAATQHTRFTCFRYAIPEVSGFQGRAIYMDSDMLMLKDIAELWRMPMNAPWKCASKKRTCVSLIDCAPFKDAQWWPRLKELKKGQLPGMRYRDMMDRNGFLDVTLPDRWNCPDGFQFSDKTAVLHFTRVQTQPWEPWPEGISYRSHDRPKMVRSGAATMMPPFPRGLRVLEEIDLNRALVIFRVE